MVISNYLRYLIVASLIITMPTHPMGSLSTKTKIGIGLAAFLGLLVGYRVWSNYKKTNQPPRQVVNDEQVMQVMGQALVGMVAESSLNSVRKMERDRTPLIDEQERAIVGNFLGGDVVVDESNADVYKQHITEEVLKLIGNEDGIDLLVKKAQSRIGIKLYCHDVSATGSSTTSRGIELRNIKDLLRYSGQIACYVEFKPFWIGLSCQTNAEYMKLLGECRIGESFFRENESRSLDNLFSCELFDSVSDLSDYPYQDSASKIGLLLRYRADPNELYGDLRPKIENPIYDWNGHELNPSERPITLLAKRLKRWRSDEALKFRFCLLKLFRDYSVLSAIRFGVAIDSEGHMMGFDDPEGCIRSIRRNDSVSFELFNQYKPIISPIILDVTDQEGDIRSIMYADSNDPALIASLDQRRHGRRDAIYEATEFPDALSDMVFCYDDPVMADYPIKLKSGIPK